MSLRHPTSPDAFVELVSAPTAMEPAVEQTAMRADDASTAPPQPPAASNPAAPGVAALLDATAALVLEVGRERITTAMVADLAGVSIGTLYRSFADRHGLLDGVRARHRARFADALVAALRPPPRDAPALARIISETTRLHHLAHPDVRVAGGSLAHPPDLELRLERDAPEGVSSARIAMAAGAVDAILRMSPGLAGRPEPALLACAMRVAEDVLRGGTVAGGARRTPAETLRTTVRPPRDGGAGRAGIRDGVDTTIMLAGALPRGLHARMAALVDGSSDLALAGWAVDLEAWRAAHPPARVTVLVESREAMLLAACAAASSSRVLLLPGTPGALRPLVDAGLATLAASTRPGTVRTAIRSLAATPSRAVVGDSAALSEREALVVARFAQGRSLDDIASELALGRESTKTYLARARRKYAALGRRAPSRVLLAVRAFEDGLL